MTDREAYAHLYCRYESKAEKKIEAHEAKLKQAEAAELQKPLEQRKREFWDLCKSYNCAEADIQKQWEAYLRN